jgi:hypothetical protein
MVTTRELKSWAVLVHDIRIMSIGLEAFLTAEVFHLDQNLHICIFCRYLCRFRAVDVHFFMGIVCGAGSDA